MAQGMGFSAAAAQISKKGGYPKKPGIPAKGGKKPPAKKAPLFQKRK